MTPTLTIMVDYGNAPFLWLDDSPDQIDIGVGELLCSGIHWDETVPMTKGLWQKFAYWAIAFNRTAFYSDSFDDSSWDWIAFHAHGLQLSRWLKEEVGDTYCVVYEKPAEDPNHRINGRVEILADGMLSPIPIDNDPTSESSRFCRHIVSGGQTGADRAALDFAIKHGYTHGGWAPRGREAEDRPIPLKYQLIELAGGGYRQRTHLNVQDSDGTFIVNVGELDGGTLATQVFAKQLAKPHLLVQLDSGIATDITASAFAWLREHKIEALNIAGPRESKRPGIYHLTIELLEAMSLVRH